jgi:hypothetical protein
VGGSSIISRQNKHSVLIVMTITNAYDLCYGTYD